MTRPSDEEVKKALSWADPRVKWANDYYPGNRMLADWKAVKILASHVIRLEAEVLALRKKLTELEGR